MAHLNGYRTQWALRLQTKILQKAESTWQVLKPYFSRTLYFSECMNITAINLHNLIFINRVKNSVLELFKSHSPSLPLVSYFSSVLWHSARQSTVFQMDWMYFLYSRRCQSSWNEKRKTTQLCLCPQSPGSSPLLYIIIPSSCDFFSPEDTSHTPHLFFCSKCNQGIKVLKSKLLQACERIQLYLMSKHTVLRCNLLTPNLPRLNHVDLTLETGIERSIFTFKT